LAGASKQLDSQGQTVKDGTIQDATFITSDPGRSGNLPRSDKAKTLRNRDGTWAEKGGEYHFGFKLHSNMDVEHGLVMGIKTTTASVHDSQVDLSVEGERVYRGKGYFGSPARGRSGP
jgi:transposase, IS5 family